MELTKKWDTDHCAFGASTSCHEDKSADLSSGSCSPSAGGTSPSADSAKLSAFTSNSSAGSICRSVPSGSKIPSYDTNDRVLKSRSSSSWISHSTWLLCLNLLLIQALAFSWRRLILPNQVLLSREQ